MRDIIPNEDVKLDFWSLLLSSFGFGLFLLGFTNVSNDGWSALLAVDAPIVIGLLLIIVFIWRSLRWKNLSWMYASLNHGTSRWQPLLFQQS